MAGFFLVKNNDDTLNLQMALNAFADKGLRTPTKYPLGTHTLYLFSKTTDHCPYIAEMENGFCAAVGAYIYKGLEFSQSLEATVDDYVNGSLDYSEMYGQYTLIMNISGQLFILSDALSTKHVFTDRQNRFFSSSFFAAVSAIGNVTINDIAVYEKMLTGIIISPDTLVNEVMSVNRSEQEKLNNADCEVTFLVHPRIAILPEHNRGRRDSIDRQAENIREYFKAIKPAISEDRVDLGLSAGHDSSLVFAAIASSYGNVHLHTHSTGHVHDREKRAAVAMAKTKGLSPTIVPTPRLDESGVDLQKLLLENLFFFDGRTSHDIGGFSATYRAEYRLMATDGCLTSLSGVGGECLRNHYSVRGSKLDADRFFMDKVFNKSFIEAAPHSLVERVKAHHIEKAEKILNAKLHGMVDRLNLRRYYSEVLMADGQGNVIDAYSIVSKCIAPFLDPHILQEAYRGIKYLGNCGEYESGIICELDPEIGVCINANNGYPFNRIPLSLRIKEALRASVSSEIWERLNSIKNIKQKNPADTYFNSVLKKNQGLARAFENMKMRFPDIDFDTVIKGYAMDASVEYLALTIGMIKNELQFD